MPRPIAKALGEDQRWYRLEDNGRVGRSTQDGWQYNFGMDTTLAALVVDGLGQIEARVAALERLAKSYMIVPSGTFGEGHPPQQADLHIETERSIRRRVARDIAEYLRDCALVNKSPDYAYAANAVEDRFCPPAHGKVFDD